MKIKQLELKGFKSFKDPTRVRFEQGISCIVGPNGCGKSNLVDAFLWVMGESAPKHLRSKAMEDVIFAGAGSFAPAGRAEVSLIMERSQLSSSKSKEIMITRRLNRDGLSEYLIDSKPARLKDVQEIFMDTGAGIHGFSFIEQGAIESFISSRPEQKKQMVESVAGIARFRFRKKSAERKLELTENNLNRLQDLLTRQDTELKKLKKQSETAKKFENLKAQARKTETELKIWDLKKLQSAENQVTKEIKAETKKQNQIRSQQEQLSRQIQSLNKERKQAREKQEKLRAEKSDLEHQLFLLEKELTGKKTALKIQREQILSALEQPAHRQNIFQVLKEKKGQITKAEQKQKALTKNWSDLKTEEESLVTQSSRFQEEKDQLLKHIGDKGHDQALLEQKLALLEEKQKESQHVLEQTKNQLRQNEEKTQNLLSKQSTLKEEQEKSRQMSFDMSSLIETEKSALRTLKKNLQQAEEKLKQLREEEAVAHSEWQSLKKRKALSESEEKAKAFILSEFQSECWDIAQAIELSSPFLERAVSSFLSLRLKSLFVLKEDLAVQALKQIQQQKQGAGRFVLPFRGESPPLAEQAKIEQSPGFQFFLADKAKGEPELIKSLFSEIAVVDHLTTALSLKKSYPTWSFITLEGEVISKEGDLIKFLDNDESNILWHKALKSAPLKYERARTLRLKWEEDLRKQAELFQNLSNKMGSLSHKERSFEIQALEIKKDLESLSREINLSLKEKTLREQDLEKAEQNQKNLKAERQLLLTKLSDCSMEKDCLQKNQSALKERTASQEHAQQALSIQKEKLWQELMACEKELVRLKEQKSMLLKSQEQAIREKEQVTLKQKEQKTLIIEEEKALAQKEKRQQALSQKIKDKLVQINQVEKEEQTGSAQKEKKEGEIQQARQEEVEGERLLNQLKFKRESFLLKKQALLESAEFAEGETWENIPLPVDFNRDRTAEHLNKINRALSRIGALNFLALKEYEDLVKENEFYQKQYEDLRVSKEKLFQVINRIDSFCSKKFKEVFEEVRGRFSKLWPILFEGGKADLILSEDQGVEGLEIKVQPPGKKIQNMSLLSGGEKAMTAVAMMFSLFLVKPSPFCILDEVDAPLDDINVTRFKALLSEMARLSQIILITHNKQSMKEAHVLYGVTMEEKGVSKIMSLKTGKKNSLRESPIQ